MSKIISPKNRGEFLSVNYLNVFESDIADRPELIVALLKIAGNNLNLGELPILVLHANVFETVAAEIAAASLVGGKHRIGRIREVVFSAYDVTISNSNIREI